MLDLAVLIMLDQIHFEIPQGFDELVELGIAVVAHIKVRESLGQLIADL